MKRGQLAIFLVVISVLGMTLAPAVLAATSNDPVTEHLNYGAYDDTGTAPGHLFVNGSVTTAQQDLAEGTSHDAIAGYEDDNGVWVANGDVDKDHADGDFKVNTSYDESSESGNFYSFKPGHIVDTSYVKFPTKNSTTTWANSSQWVVQSGSSNVTVSNTTVNADVQAVNFASTPSSEASGDNIYKVKYEAWAGELDSDESKRVLQFAADINTLEANAEIHIYIYDESGSYKHFTINSSRNFNNNNTVLGNATKDFVKQVKLSTVTTNGPDSTFDNIENVTIEVDATGTSANSDFSISWLDLRKKSKNTLGEQRATTDDSGTDNDGDGDYDEIQTIHNATNAINVTSMKTLDTEYDDAIVNDLTYPFRYDVTGLERRGQDGTYDFAWLDPVNPSFDDRLNLTVSLKLPSAVDLSYSNTETRLVQAWDDGRYVSFESASDVADSTNLSQAAFSDDSGSLGSTGTTVTIDSSTSAGERIVLQLEIEFSDSERTDNIEAAAATPAGGVPPPGEKGPGGILGFGPAGDFVALLGVIGSFLVGIPQRAWRGLRGLRG